MHDDIGLLSCSLPKQIWFCITAKSLFSNETALNRIRI